MAFYDAIPASDGTSLTAPENAEFKVYEVSDTARANPLPLLSTAGLNAAPLVTTAQGVVPPVEVVSPNFEHIFVSGGWEWRRESSEGIKRAAEQSAKDAASARLAAEASAKEAQKPTDAMVDRGIERADIPGKVAGAVANTPEVSSAAAQLAQSDAGLVHKTDAGMPTIGDSEDTLVMIRDIDGFQTWLGARASDGGPTEWAMHHIQERIGVGAADAPEYLFAVTDDQRRLTDLVVRASDGQFPDFVIDRLRSRILDGHAPTLPTPQPEQSARTYADFPYAPGSDIHPIHADMSRAAGWGSSSMQGIDSRLASWFTSKGVQYLAGGKGAERIDTIAARMGAVPALITIAGNKVPSSGSAKVTASNVETNYALRAYSGTLGGVDGTISYDPGSAGYIFTRATPGDEVALAPGTPFAPANEACRDAVNLLWMGKNDLGQADSAERVISLTDTCFNWLAPLNKRALVLGHFINTGHPAQNGERSRINAVNAAHRKRYGRAFVDVGAYLTGAKVWSDAGITPTATDLAEQALGNKPPSLSSDSGHLNEAGYDAVAEQIATRLMELGWYN